MQTSKDALIGIFGLSADPNRFAYLAATKLLNFGYRNLVGKHPKGGEVLGVPIFSKIGQIEEALHTLTMYVGPSKSALLAEEIVSKQSKRIIFNPGAECAELRIKAEQAGIEVVHDCTLIMLDRAYF